MRGSRDKEAAPALGAQRSVHGSDMLPVSAIGGVGNSSIPPLVRQLLWKVPGWRPLGLELGTDRTAYQGLGCRRKVLGARLVDAGRPLASWPWSRRLECLLRRSGGVGGHHVESGQK